MALNPSVRVAALIVCCMAFALLANACGGGSTGPAHEQSPSPPGKVPFSQVWLDWMLPHAPVSPSTMPLKGWTIASPGVLQLQFDGTPVLPETDPPITVTEQTTVTLRVPHP